MPKSQSIIEGEFSPLYNTLSKYLPDDFPPGPPFSNDRDGERYVLIRTIEDFNYLNTELWGPSSGKPPGSGKSHGFLLDGVPLSFNWVDFAINYGPKLDGRFPDPQKALNALKEIYVAFGFREDSWRKNKQARREAKLLYDQGLKNLAKRHAALSDHEMQKMNFGLKELTQIMFGHLLKKFDHAMTKAHFSEHRRKELLNFFLADLMNRARYITKGKEAMEILLFNEQSELYTFHNTHQSPYWYKKY